LRFPSSRSTVPLYSCLREVPRFDHLEKPAGPRNTSLW
jgi:hypothetical protein